MGLVKSAVVLLAKCFAVGLMAYYIGAFFGQGPEDAFRDAFNYSFGVLAGIIWERMARL